MAGTYVQTTPLKVPPPSLSGFQLIIQRPASRRDANDLVRRAMRFADIDPLHASHSILPAAAGRSLNAHCRHPAHPPRPYHIHPHERADHAVRPPAGQDSFDLWEWARPAQSSPSPAPPVLPGLTTVADRAGPGDAAGSELGGFRLGMSTAAIEATMKAHDLRVKGVTRFVDFKSQVRTM